MIHQPRGSKQVPGTTYSSYAVEVVQLEEGRDATGIPLRIHGSMIIRLRYTPHRQDRRSVSTGPHEELCSTQYAEKQEEVVAESTSHCSLRFLPFNPPPTGHVATTHAKKDRYTYTYEVLDRINPPPPPPPHTTSWPGVTL